MRVWVLQHAAGWGRAEQEQAAWRWHRCHLAPWMLFPSSTPSPLCWLRKAWLHPSPLCHRQGLLPAPSLPVSRCNWPAEPGPALPGPLHQGQDVAVEARGGIQTPDEVPVVPVSNVHVGDDVGNAGQQQVHVPPVGCPVLTS